MDCGGFKHRAAEYASRKKAQIFSVVGAEIMRVGTNEDIEESGKDSASPQWMVVWLTEKVLF